MVDRFYFDNSTEDIIMAINNFDDSIWDSAWAINNYFINIGEGTDTMEEVIPLIDNVRASYLYQEFIMSLAISPITKSLYKDILNLIAYNVSEQATVQKNDNHLFAQVLLDRLWPLIEVLRKDLQLPINVGIVTDFLTRVVNLKLFGLNIGLPAKVNNKLSSQIVNFFWSERHFKIDFHNELILKNYLILPIWFISKSTGDGLGNYSSKGEMIDNLKSYLI